MITNSQGMIFNFKDIYNTFKTKVSNEVRYTTYFDILYNTLLEMFDYTGLPETLDARFMESILHSTGQVFVADIEGDIVATSGTLSGEIDAYGMGTECIAVCPTGEATGRRNIDIAYGINNKTATPDLLVYWISHLMQETDNSLDHIIKYSRLLPIPKVSDEKDKAMFDDLIDKLLAGDFKAFASKNKLADELGENTADVFNISDVNKVDKLQYLSRFGDDILKKFYNFYGQPINSQNKLAQSIRDEIHGMDSVSFILPLQMLKCRRELCDNINKIFGLSVSVKFSETWNLEYNSLVLRDTNENGIIDTKETPEQAETPEQTETPEQAETPEQTETPEQAETQEQTETPEQVGELVELIETLDRSDVETLTELIQEIKESEDNDGKD